MPTEKKRKVIIDILFIALMLVVGYFVIKYVAVWTLPFIIGFIVAIILQKPVDFLDKKTKVPRTVWAISLVLAVLCAIFGVITLIIWAIINNSDGFGSWLMSLIPDIKKGMGNVSNWFFNITDKLPEGVGAALENSPGTVIETAVTTLASFVTGFAEWVITQGPGLLIATIFSVVASCYMTKDYRKITDFILAQMNDKKKNLLVNIKKLFVTNILKMLRGYIIIMFITFLELFAGLSLLRVNYAAILAVIIAVLDILPVIGTGAVLIPWGITAMIMGNFILGIGLIGMYLAILVVRNIIEPRIIGQQVGLPPIVTLIAMYAGLKIFGVLGMMLFPVVIIITVKLQEAGIIHLWKVPEGTIIGKKRKASKVLLPKKEKKK